MDHTKQITELQNHISQLAVQASCTAGQLQAMEATLCAMLMVASHVEGSSDLVEKELERALAINLGTSLNTHFLDSFEATATLIRHALSHLDEAKKLQEQHQRLD